MFHRNYYIFMYFIFFWPQIIFYSLVGTLAQSQTQHQFHPQIDLSLRCTPGRTNLRITWNRPNSSQIAERLLNDYRFE